MVGLFEITHTSRFATTTQVRDLLGLYNLLNKVAYIENEGGNLSTLTKALTFVMTCAPMAFVTPWQGSCFGHAFNKACQYALNDQVKYVSGFERLVWIIHSSYCKKKTLGWKNPTRVQ
jgi:hypothetical protein